MAITWTDVWFQPSTLYTHSSCARIGLNGGGTDYENVDVFDYFPDTAVVGDYLQFGITHRYWGIRLYVGTPFVADSVTFVWEYQDMDKTWQTLRVLNGDALLAAGQQDVMFTPPSDWRRSDNSFNYSVRCRIAALTNLTEGGAQSTQAVQFDLKPIQLTGTVTDLGSAVTADRAGSYTLLPATTPATGLIPIAMTGYELGIAQRVTITLASSDAAAGDTVTVSGVDAEGTVLSEDVDVSAGDGDYTTAASFADVVQVDCNGFAAGTIAVNQTRWGVIYALDRDAYVLTTCLQIGDNGTATTVTLHGAVLTFCAGACWYCYKGAFSAGTVTGEGEAYESDYRGITTYECCRNDSALSGRAEWQRCLSADDVITHRGCTYVVTGGSARTDPWWYFYRGAVSFTDCRFRRTRALAQVAIGTDVAITIDGLDLGDVSLQLGTAVTAVERAITADRIICWRSDDLTLRECASALVEWNANGYDLYCIDCDYDETSFSIWYSVTRADVVILAYSYALVVVDSAGAVLASMRVRIEDAGGAAVLTDQTDVNGEIATELQYKSADQAGSTTLVWTTDTPHTIKIGAYAYTIYSYAKNMTAAASDQIPLSDDTFITEADAATALAYTGIAVDHGAGLVTVTEAHTIAELYDYLKALNVSSDAEFAYDQILTTVDGVNYQCAYDLTIDGVQLTGTGTLDLGAGTYTAANGGGTTLVVTDATGTSVAITVNSVVDGSRIQVYDVTDDVELANEVVSGTSYTYTFQHTGTDHEIRIRLMYVSGAATAYEWYETTGTVTSSGLTITAQQEANDVYTTNNVDGSTVTECSISGSTIRIYVDDPDNTTTVQRLYNWYQYILFTEAGIRDQDGDYIVARDSTHYTFASGMSIVNQDLTNPLNITGANIVPSSGDATDVFDLSNGASIALNFERVEGFAYSSGSGLSTEEHDALLDVDTAVASYLDAAITSRLADADYTAPDNASIAAILEDTGTTLAAAIAALQVDLDNPDQYKADVSALATAAALTTVDEIVDAIKAKTDNLPATPAATGDAMTLTAAERAALNTALGADGYDLDTALAILLAVLAGKSSGQGTDTVTFRDLADATDRVVGTLDDDGNRTAVTIT